MAAYGNHAPLETVELDHIVSLSVGGAVNDPDGHRRRHPVLMTELPRSDRAHRRLTPSQKRLLGVIRSFGPAGATARQIRL